MAIFIPRFAEVRGGLRALIRVLRGDMALEVRGVRVFAFTWSTIASLGEAIVVVILTAVVQ